MTDPVASAAKYNLTSLLGDLGSLPFILLAGVMADAHFNGPGLHSASVLGLYAPYVFIAYSAVILSFLSGALWATARANETERLATAIIIFSNLVALAAWASLMLIYVAPILTVFAVTLLMAGFVSILWAERVMNSLAGEPKTSYWSMRLRITILVVVWHTAVIFMMIQEL